MRKGGCGIERIFLGNSIRQKIRYGSLEASPTERYPTLQIENEVVPMKNVT
jgi:hypothetical protein